MDIAEDVLTKEDIVKAIGAPPESITKAGKAISAGNLKHVDDAIAALNELKNKTAPVEQELEEDDDLKAEDIAKAVTAAMAPIAKQVEGLTAEIADLKKRKVSMVSNLQVGLLQLIPQKRLQLPTPLPRLLHR